MEIGILTEILNLFIGAFSGGADRLRPAIGGLLRMFVTLDVLFFALMVLFDIEPVKGGLRKLLTLSLWTYVIQDFDSHANNIVNSLVRAGLTAAGQGGMSPQTLLNPSAIMDGAFVATQPIADHMLEVSLLSINGTYILFGFTYIFMMIAYFILALSALIVVIEYYMALAITGILMPFGVLAPTRWLAMKPVSYFVSCGLKMMVISFIMAVSRDVLGGIRFASEEPSLREMWIAVCAAGTISMLAWVAPQRMAAGFMAGSAALGADNAVSHAAGVAGGAAWVTAPLRSGAVGRAAGAVGKTALVGAAAGGAALFGAARSAFGRSSPATTNSSAGAASASGARVSPLTASAVATTAKTAPARPQLVASDSSAPEPRKA